MKLVQLFLFQLFLIITYASQAQTSSWQLYGEGNGNEVRLFWTAFEWNDSIQGFYIKRRIAGGNWTKLTSSPVYPLISTTKNLNNVCNDPTVIDRLKKEISANPADYSGTDSVTFMEAIKVNGGLAMLTYALSRDYNKALITGLAFYDKKINTSKGKLIEYGLFPIDQKGQISGPVSTFKWKFGEKPKYQMEVTSSVRLSNRKNEIRIVWKIKTSTYLDEKVLYGFHVDRVDNSNRTRLTSVPILPSTAEEFITIFQYDNPDNRKYAYELIPVSVMGYESLPYKALYDPSLIPDEFPVTLISNYKDGDTSIAFTIQVPEEKEKFIESFELEEKTGIVDYKSLLGPFTGKKQVSLPYDTSRHARYTYEFRLKVNLKDDYPSLFSNGVKVIYFPIIAPKVTGLKAELVKENNKYFARLTWNKSPVAKEYHIYTKDSYSDEMIGEGSLPTITGNEYLFPLVNNGFYQTYTFAVAGKGKVGETMGELSDTVNVTTPTQNLLRVGIVEYKQDEDKKVLIAWKYNEPADLKGYRLFENDQMVADEKVLQKGTLQWKSEPREPGTYSYTIEAVTELGIVSIRSFVRTVIVK